jgi:ribosomal protein S18 acetylase RimI-like enzyme
MSQGDMMSGYAITRLEWPADEVRLQEFLERCSDYYELHEACPTPPDTAVHELTAVPDGRRVDDLHVYGMAAPDGALVAIAQLLRNHPKNGEWFIGLLLVAPSMRGRGVGAELVEHVAGLMRVAGVETVHLAVSLKNPRAQAFWERMGFVDRQQVTEVTARSGYVETVRIMSRGTRREAARLSFHRATAEDRQFLGEMFVEAALWRPEWPRVRPDELLSRAELARYFADWGRAGDTAIVAVSADDPGVRIGAGWYRTFSADEPGYGFIREEVPELGIAVRARWRGCGAGRAILERLQQEACAAGLPGLSLSVHPENRAVGMYRKAGFVEVASSEAALTMFWNAREDGDDGRTPVS